MNLRSWSYSSLQSLTFNLKSKTSKYFFKQEQMNVYQFIYQVHIRYGLCVFVLALLFNCNNELKNARFVQKVTYQWMKKCFSIADFILFQTCKSYERLLVHLSFDETRLLVVENCFCLNKESINADWLP